MLIINMGQDLNMLIHILIIVAATQAGANFASQLSALEQEIAQLQIHNQILPLTDPAPAQKQKFYKTLASVAWTQPHMENVAFAQLPIFKDMQNSCEVSVAAKGQHFLFQTPRGSYFVVNNPERKLFSIYSSNCGFVASVERALVRQIFCDRGLCDDGNLVIITHEYYLMGCSEANNFTQCSIFASLGNSIKGQYAGGALRNKGSGQFELYIADSLGEVTVIDWQGRQKLKVPLEKDSQIAHFVDMHPYPLIITDRSWIYIFDNVKYTITLSKCPYPFHRVEAAFVAHPYSSILYLISEHVVTKMKVKAQSRSCEMVGQALLHNKITGEEVSHSQIAEYQGDLYIRNKIIDFQNQTVSSLDECGSQAAFNFQMMKNNYRKGFFTLKCCLHDKCSVMTFKSRIQDQSSSKNNTVIMIVILMMVLLVLFYFFRSGTPNLDYDEELRHNHNLKYKNEVEQYLRAQANEKSQRVRKQQSTQKQNLKQQ